MVKIIWTQRSLSDLRSIAEYISKDSAKYASLTLERIIDLTKHIEANPRIGRMVPEVGRNDIIREIIFGNYCAVLSSHRDSLSAKEPGSVAGCCIG